MSVCIQKSFRFAFIISAAAFLSPALVAEAQTTQETNADAAASSANTIFGASGPSSTDTTVLVQPTTVTNSSTFLPTGAQNPTGGGELGYSCPSPSLAFGGSTSGRLTNQAPFGSMQVAISIPLGSSADCKKGLASKVRQDQMNAQILEEAARQKEFETAVKTAEWNLKLSAQKLELFKNCLAASKESGIAVALIPGCDTGLSTATALTPSPPVERKFVPASDGLGNSYSSDTPAETVSSPEEALSTKRDTEPRTESSESSPSASSGSDQGSSPESSEQGSQSPAESPAGAAESGDSLLEQAADAEQDSGGSEGSENVPAETPLSSEQVQQDYGSVDAPASKPFDFDEFIEGQGDANRGEGLPKLEIRRSDI